MTVDKDDIMQGLRALGVQPGMGLIVHSSLRSFGYVQGGALAVIEALRGLLTAEGTLLMPSFNHGAPFGEHGPGVYDPLSTPTSNGAIADLFWRQPGVHRSLDPTHPVAAWGKHAQRYTAQHHRTLTMGPQSPLGLLHADGGSCLLLGVDYTSNTFHHVVETTVGAPCLGQRTEAYPVQLQDGRQVIGRTWGWRNASCPYTDEDRYGAEMRAQQLERVALIGPCRARLFALRGCFDLVAHLLQHGKDGFPACHACPVRPRVVAQTVTSDWDAETQMPQRDSVAWTY